MNAAHLAGMAGSRAESGPDFRHVKNWIFDLDNTLYSADCGIFAQIEGRMTDYVARFTGLPRDQARALQKDLYRRHGTTLNGLMRLHGADPDDYLDYVHDIDLTGLTSDPRLAAAVGRLAGRRFIFTNGCRRHAVRILERIGALHLFEEIWDIRTIGFTPKPDALAYDRVVAAAGIESAGTAMFDDIVHNLVAARALGMTTVWLRNNHEFSPGEPVADVHRHVCHQTDDLPQFLNDIRI